MGGEQQTHEVYYQRELRARSQSTRWSVTCAFLEPSKYISGSLNVHYIFSYMIMVPNERTISPSEKAGCDYGWIDIASLEDMHTFSTLCAGKEGQSDAYAGWIEKGVYHIVTQYRQIEYLLFFRLTYSYFTSL